MGVSTQDCIPHMIYSLRAKEKMHSHMSHLLLPSPCPKCAACSECAASTSPAVRCSPAALLCRLSRDVCVSWAPGTKSTQRAIPALPQLAFYNAQSEMTFKKPDNILFTFFLPFTVKC